MALKDWKKTISGCKMKRRYLSQEIFLSKIATGYYMISIDDLQNFNKKNYSFNSKSQALKFARAYMKKH